MTFLDTNIFVRALVEPVGEVDARMAEECRTLLRWAEQRDVLITTSEAVLAEVAYVLASPKVYGLKPDRIRDLLTPILSLRGTRVPAGDRVRRALSLWAEYPHLGFEDALTAAQVLDDGSLELCSYDKDFDRIEGLKRRTTPDGAMSRAARASSTPE